MSIWSEPPKEPLAMAIRQDDEEMKEAYRQAAKTLSDFMSHLKLKADWFCSVKLCFRDPDLSEHFGEDCLLYWWLDNVRFDAERGLFSAEFTEVPTGLEEYHSIGQRLWINGEDIFDWRVNRNGCLYGGFTIRVARSRLQLCELADYDKYIGVTEYSETTAP